MAKDSSPHTRTLYQRTISFIYSSNASFLDFAYDIQTLFFDLIDDVLLELPIDLRGNGLPFSPVFGRFLTSFGVSIPYFRSRCFNRMAIDSSAASRSFSSRSSFSRGRLRPRVSLVSRSNATSAHLR